MATAAFRSTSRRTSIGGDTSLSNSNSNSARQHRRSRSVSRFSHRGPAEDAADEPPSTIRRGKFVNTVRGSEFPEISLDDLAIEMFSLSDVSSSANNDGDSVAVSRRRGRSVSRRVSDVRSKSKSVRRRRSLSVAPRSASFVSDSENEHFQKNRSRVDSRNQKPVQKSAPLKHQRGLRRCNSQKDFLKSYDGYTSYSSTLSDDEGSDARYIGREIENGMQASTALVKGSHVSSSDRNNMLYKSVKKEYSHFDRDNIIQLKGDNKLPGPGANDSRRSAETDALKVVSTIRRNYKTKLEESEKRKEELLAEILLEEERGKELKKIVVDLLPNAKETSPVKRPMRGRKRSVDRMSKKLVEDADKIIEDFISSVEETDISSFDGERSDTSSIVGGAIRPMMHYGDIESFRSPLRSELHPVEMDGVVLPWLKWDAGEDGTPLPRNDNKKHPATPTTVLQDALEELTCGTDQEPSVDSKSSRGSWSPGIANSFCMDIGETSRTGEVESCNPRKSRFDIDDYPKRPTNDNILSEIWKQRDIIHSGGLLICNGGSLGKFLI
ncbi:hypothetical protein vseg_013679 [Gypsophila vaccaria]